MHPQKHMSGLMLQHVHDNTPLSNCIHKGIAVVLDIEHIKVAISV